MKKILDTNTKKGLSIILGLPEKIKCPTCEGCGEIDNPELRFELSNTKANVVKNLRARGFTYGEIVKTTGMSKALVAYHAKKISDE